MLDAYLASLQARLQRRDRRVTWTGAIVTLAGCGLLVKASTERIPLGDKIGAMVCMAFMAYVGIAAIRRSVGRSSALTARLREHPAELRTVELAWMSGPTIPRARLTFELQDGTRFVDGPLDEDAARAAAAAIRPAYPWTFDRKPSR